MHVKSYWYAHGNPIIEDLRRDKYMYSQYLNMAADWLSSFVPVGDKVAVLYAGGVMYHHSDVRDMPVKLPKGAIALKTQAAYTAHRFAKKLGAEVDYVSVNGNTCASSLYALFEAEMLISAGFSDVVVYTEEMEEPGLQLFFKQSRVDLMCGDGAAIMHLTGEDKLPSISDCMWSWNNESSPMTVSKEGYSKVLKGNNVEFVKVHGSGTAGNEVEVEAIAEVFPAARVIGYKSLLGHTQGASGLIEAGILLDDDSVAGTGMLLASGLGGFYGSARITK